MERQAKSLLADLRDLQRIKGVLNAASGDAQERLRRARVRLKRIRSIQAVVRASAPPDGPDSDTSANLELLRQLEASAQLKVEAARLQCRALNASGRPMSRILAHLEPLLPDAMTVVGRTPDDQTVAAGDPAPSEQPPPDESAAPDSSSN